MRKRPETTTPNADDSAVILARWIRDQNPFAYVRFGDGDIMFMYGLRDGKTADGETNSPELSARLRRAWCTIASHERAIVGDFLTCGDFGKAGEQEHFVEWQMMIHLASPRRMLSVEAPLLTRKSAELLDLFRAIQADPRPKLLVAPGQLRRGAVLLGSDFHEIPYGTAFNVVDDLVHTLKKSAAEVIYFCAGRTTKVVMAELLQHDDTRTYFDLGSALDPICLPKKTRGVQLQQEDALEFFDPLFGCKLEALENMKVFHDVAFGLELPFCLMDGTLLGIYRDGDLCPGDEDDVDVGVPDEYFDRVTEFCAQMKTHGFRQSDVFVHRGKVEGVKLQRGRSHFDIIRIHKHATRPECYNLGRMPGKVLAFVYPAEHHSNGYGQLRFVGRLWPTPTNIEGFLTARYGDWKTPIAREAFDWFNQSNRDSIRTEYDAL